MQEFLLAFLIAVIVGSIVNGCSESATDTTSANNGNQSSPANPTANAAGSSQVSEVSEASFDREVLKSSQPVLVEFGATWCVPCKNMAPVLDQLSVEYSGKLKVIKVDADESPKLAEKYTTGELPTMIIFKNGEPKEKLIGEVPKERLVGLLKGYTG